MNAVKSCLGMALAVFAENRRLPGPAWYQPTPGQLRVGLTVEVEAEGDEAAHPAQRQLDLLAALEFNRLHAALSRKVGAARARKRKCSAESLDLFRRARVSAGPKSWAGHREG